MRQFTYSEVMRECNQLIADGHKDRINMIQIQKLDNNRFAAEVIRGGIREPIIEMESSGYGQIKQELYQKYLLMLPPCSHLCFFRNKKHKTVAYIQMFMEGNCIVDL